MKHRATQRITDRDTDAYDAGAEARCTSQPISSNPYPKGSTTHVEWSRGWRKAGKNAHRSNASAPNDGASPHPRKKKR